ncbi:hemolysin family protein [Candidatus Gracilibacteria bacterium]|nr:hemolysin family protein [Candidatus Gracilibacteria bacterium]
MEFIIILILTLLNGFFALSEIALVSVKKSKIEHLASKGNKKAKIILTLLENPENFLSSVQVGITLIGIISGAYGGSAIANDIVPHIATIPFLGDHAEGIALTVAIIGITYFSIVVGELVPKTIAMNNPEGLALFCVPVLRYFMFLTYPFVKLLSISTLLTLKTLGIKDAVEERLSEEELIGILKTAGKQGVLNKEESIFHNNVFSFGEQVAKSIITHRNEVEWIDINDNKQVIFNKIKESVHSKFVVADESLDNVVGILQIKDFLENQDKLDFSLKNIISKAILIPEQASAMVILNTFKKRKQYIGVVVDEFGGTEGIITLHDLIEVIVGNLPEENEETEGNIIKNSENTYLLNGKTLIYEINQYFQEEIIEDSNHEYTTLSGYIMHNFGRLPKVSEKIKQANNYELEIVDMDGIKIDKVLIRKIEE